MENIIEKNQSFRDIMSLIMSGRRLIYIHHEDFERVDDFIMEAAKKRKIKKENLLEFNHAFGRVGFHYKTEVAETITDLATFLKKMANRITGGFVVLKDIHRELEDVKVGCLLKHIALSKKPEKFVVFIVSSILKIPQEIELYVSLVRIPMPEKDEIKAKVYEHLKSLKIGKKSRNDDYKEELDKILEANSVSLKGMTMRESIEIVNLAYTRNAGSLQNEKFRVVVNEEKEKKIQKSGLLEFVKIDVNEESIGGLLKLKEHLKNKAKIYSRIESAIKNKVDIPKGVLIVGVPGCGKSLTAKVTSSIFNTSLLRLDVGKMLGKYVGESEENLRKALEIAEAVSPCVLWIDEIEKAFSGIGTKCDGNGVTNRLFGNFITWMQENKLPIYVVATANDITMLPPEFLRKGRFDDKFYVDLPNKEDRREIFKIHFKMRDIDQFRNEDLDEFATSANNFSGADIESVVKQVKEKSFIDSDCKINSAFVQSIIKNSKIYSTKLIGDMRSRIEEFGFSSASS